MTPTIDQLLTPTGGQTYSIQDVLSAIGNQYQAKPSYTPSLTIDQVLAGIGGVPAAPSPYETGAKRFVSDVAPSAEYFKPAEFDAEKYRMMYESAADKAQRIYNETYADKIAAGKSEAEAQKEAAENAQFWGTVGSLAGGAFGGRLGAVAGGFVGSELGNALDKATEQVSDFFGW